MICFNCKDEIVGYNVLRNNKFFCETCFRKIKKDLKKI